MPGDHPPSEVPGSVPGSDKVASDGSTTVAGDEELAQRLAKFQAGDDQSASGMSEGDRALFERLAALRAPTELERAVRDRLREELTDDADLPGSFADGQLRDLSVPTEDVGPAPATAPDLVALQKRLDALNEFGKTLGDTHDSPAVDSADLPSIDELTDRVTALKLDAAISSACRRKRGTPISRA